MHAYLTVAARAAIRTLPFSAVLAAVLYFFPYGLSWAQPVAAQSLMQQPR